MSTRESVRYYVQPVRITSGQSATFVYDVVDTAGEHAPVRYCDAHTAVLSCDLREDDSARALARVASVATARSTDEIALADGTTAPRGEVRMSFPSGPGRGMTRRWTRVLRGKLYSFTATTMPNGELRYSASRWRNSGGLPGTPGHPAFACEWTNLHACVTIPAGRECLWENEDHGFWGVVKCDALAKLFDVSATKDGRPRVSADAVTDHAAACTMCQDDNEIRVSLLTNGRWLLEV